MRREARRAVAGNCRQPSSSAPREASLGKMTSCVRRGATEEQSVNRCEHFEQIRDVVPSAHGCEDCIKAGDTWNELRICLTCGHVGCCDDSDNRHASKHFETTQHPLIKSFDPGETWGWCYLDKRYFDDMPDGAAGSRRSFLRRLFAR
jgi:uncharacterized UBP type Zn finger protein